MTRRLLNLLTALSLLLCAALLVVWLCSYGRPASRTFARHKPLFGELPGGPVYYDLRSADGELSVTAIRGTYLKSVFSFLAGSKIEPPGRFTRETASGYDVGLFSVASGDGSMHFGEALQGPIIGNNVPYRSLRVSYFFAGLLALVLPVAWYAGYVARRTRRRAGHCPSCGYDLRATPGSCPECGGTSSIP
jgi:hypothetical protein